MKYSICFAAILGLVVGAYAFNAKAEEKLKFPPPASIGSYQFLVTGTGDFTLIHDQQQANKEIRIIGIDISTEQVSDGFCRWGITREGNDFGNPGGITASTVLFNHEAFELGSVHHEFKEPAVVSLGRKFSMV